MKSMIGFEALSGVELLNNVIDRYSFESLKNKFVIFELEYSNSEVKIKKESRFKNLRALDLVMGNTPGDIPYLFILTEKNEIQMGVCTNTQRCLFHYNLKTQKKYLQSYQDRTCQNFSTPEQEINNLISAVVKLNNYSLHS